jgi:rSAM/selenodomain-associated transferase 2
VFWESGVREFKAPRTADRRGDGGVYMKEGARSGDPAGGRDVRLVSVVVPALDEADVVPSMVEALALQQAPPPFEVVLADGGSVDDTVGRFVSAAAALLPGRPATIVRCGRRGRAMQMNAGAAAARGDALVFVHADTLLPPAGLAMVARALGRRGVAGGGFRLAYQERHPGLALIAAWASARSRLTGIHYGDQAMFLWRDFFERLGRFPEVPLFEDYRLSARLRREGRVITLPLAVRTSARRLLHAGIARTALRFAWLKLRHARGADPADLAKDYRDVR